MNCKFVLLSATLATVAALLSAGCTTNTSAVKSAEGKVIEPVTKELAKQQSSQLATVKGGPAQSKRDGRLEAVALFPELAQPTGVSVSKAGRIFLSYPRWNDPVRNTVVELQGDKLVPFPDEKTNAFDGTDLAQYPPDRHFVSVQSVVFDAQDRLWVLDPGSFNFAPNILNAPKLWAYDINSRQRVKAISFPTDVALKMTYLNDVRIDLNRGSEGTAYITDSGAGGIIVVDLASGESWRHLDGHPSVMPTPGLVQQHDGEPLMMRKKSGEVMPPDVRSDGIALSPDGKTLYYSVVAGRDIWAIPTDLLADRNPENEAKVREGVKKIATKPSGNDGLICDAQGRIYSTDFEDNAIRRIDPNSGKFEVVTQDARLIWPDTLAIHGGYLYITSNQLARQPNFHFGKEMRKPPYALFRLPIETGGPLSTHAD